MKSDKQKCPAPRDQRGQPGGFVNHVNSSTSADPVQVVLAKLDGVKKTGNGWLAKCPAHDDNKASLSIGVGNDGRALLNCFAGCSRESVVTAIGLTMADLFCPKIERSASMRATKIYATANEAVAALELNRGKRSALYVYRNSAGEPVGCVARWDTEKGKDILPVSLNSRGWVFAGMHKPRPLYGLPALREASRVYVCEGEKCCDALHELGLTATTSAGGSQAAAMTDWKPLSGKEAVILPDNDKAGMKYASNVSALLVKLNPPASVRIVELPGLGDGEDVYDYIARRRGEGAGDDAIKAEIESLADTTEPIKPERPSAPAPWRSFPTDLLPRPVARFVRENAAAKQCDESLIALPALAVLAASIGTTREVMLRDDWREPPTIWSCVIIRSGGVKSPALDAALKPLVDAEHEAQLQNQQAFAEYDADYQRYQKTFARWKADKGDGGPPERPVSPCRRRHVASDITTEALAPILRENERGVLIARDELAGLVRSFNQYKSEKGGDTETWLQLHRAGFVLVDRKTNRETIYIPRTTVSITGTIQPSVFSTVMQGEYLENGLTARFLLAWPPPRRKRFTDKSPSPSVVSGYNAVIGGLLHLEHDLSDGQHRPVALTMTPDARTLWAKWYDIHADRQFNAPTDADASALAKLEAYGARFGLIFALVRNPSARAVDADDIERGCKLADWFAHEAERVYAEIADEDAGGLGHVVRWIQGRGGETTPRDLSRGPREFRGNTDKARFVLQTLVDNGRGSWRYEGGKQGPTSQVFVLNSGDTQNTGDTGDSDAKADDAAKNADIVAVATVATCNTSPADDSSLSDEELALRLVHGDEGGAR